MTLHLVADNSLPASSRQAKHLDKASTLLKLADAAIERELLDDAAPGLNVPLMQLRLVIRGVIGELQALEATP